MEFKVNIKDQNDILGLYKILYFLLYIYDKSYTFYHIYFLNMNFMPINIDVILIRTRVDHLQYIYIQSQVFKFCCRYKNIVDK